MVVVAVASRGRIFWRCAACDIEWHGDPVKAALPAAAHEEETGHEVRISSDVIIAPALDAPEGHPAK